MENSKELSTIKKMIVILSNGDTVKAVGYCELIKQAIIEIAGKNK